jgi:hypothetical protein
VHRFPLTGDSIFHPAVVKIRKVPRYGEFDFATPFLLLKLAKAVGRRQPALTSL